MLLRPENFMRQAPDIVAQEDETPGRKRDKDKARGGDGAAECRAARPASRKTAAERQREQSQTQRLNRLAMALANLNAPSIPGPGLLAAPDPADAGGPAADDPADENAPAPRRHTQDLFRLGEEYFPRILAGLSDLLETQLTQLAVLIGGMSDALLQDEAQGTHQHARLPAARRRGVRPRQHNPEPACDQKALSAAPKLLAELTRALTRTLDHGMCEPAQPAGTGLAGAALARLDSPQDRLSSHERAAVMTREQFIASFEAISAMLDLMLVNMALAGILRATQRTRRWTV
ncbi:MAG: hypothetical protein ACKV2V_26980 [Blastocatellia bacterium]